MVLRTCEDKQPFDERINKKFAEDLDYFGEKYDKEYKINHDVAVFNYNWAHFLTEEELKTTEERPPVLEPAQIIDLNAAERIKKTKEDFKQNLVKEEL